MGTELNSLDDLVEQAKARRISRRQFVQHAALLGLSLSTIEALLARCAPAPTVTAPSAASPTASPTAAPTATATPEPVTLSYFDWPRPSEAAEAEEKRLIDAFEAAYPNVKIVKDTISYSEYDEKLMTRLRAGNPPDFGRIYEAWISRYAKEGVLADLSEYVTPELRAQYLPSSMAVMEWEGKPTGLPINVSTLGLFYNKDYLTAAGIEIPASKGEAWTMDQFAEIAKTTQDASEAAYGFSLYRTFFVYPYFMYTFGGSLLTEDLSRANVNSPESVRAIEWLAQQHKAGVAPVSAIASASVTEGEDMFAAGLTAMVFTGSWRVSFFDSNLTQHEWGVTYLPAAERRAGQHGINAYVVFADSPHIKEAFDFISFATDYENMKSLDLVTGYLPTRVDLQDIEYPIRPDAMSILMQGMEDYSGQWAREQNLPEMTPVVPVLLEQIELAALGEKLPQDAADAIAAEINAQLTG
jgi:ABC-type glycerol-3-phosphate transport system substrate-binding protein